MLSTNHHLKQYLYEAEYLPLILVLIYFCLPLSFTRRLWNQIPCMKISRWSNYFNSSNGILTTKSKFAWELWICTISDQLLWVTCKIQGFPFTFWKNVHFISNLAFILLDIPLRKKSVKLDSILPFPRIFPEIVKRWGFWASRGNSENITLKYML